MAHESKRQRVGALLVLAASAGVILEVQRHYRAESAASASASAAPIPIPAPVEAERPAVEAALAALVQRLTAEVGQSPQPWVHALGLWALGRERVSRETALSLGTYAKKVRAGEADVLGFEQREGTRTVERYPAALVTILVGAGYPLDTELQTSAGPATLGTVLGDIRRARPETIADNEWAHFAWTLEALTLESLRSDSLEDTRVLDRARWAAFHRMERATDVVTRFAGATPGSGAPGTLAAARRDKAGVYEFDGDGLHLTEALFRTAGAAGDEALARRARRQIGALLFRYEVERGEWLARTSGAPEDVATQVEALGYFCRVAHALVIANRTVRGPSRWPADEVGATVRRAVHDALDVLGDLERGHAFDTWSSGREAGTAEYLDSVECVALAVRALQASLEAFEANPRTAPRAPASAD